MKGNSLFYDINPMLSKKDINGDTPSMRIITGNRAGGKTHAMEEYLLSSIRKKRVRKFALLCRYKYELDDLAEGFFATSAWMHPGMTYETARVYKTGYSEIMLNGIHMGYGICIGAADNLKRLSGRFHDVDICIWDEFQREDERYLPREILQLNSVISTVSRGEGKKGRFVPFFMISNFISLLSPLLSALEIEKRLKSDTTYVRGEGFVFEQKIVLDALKEQAGNTASRALTRTQYLGGSTVRYLNDRRDAIETPKGRYKYCENFSSEGNTYAILYFPDRKILHATKKVDSNFKICYSKDMEEISEFVLVPRHITMYRDYFYAGRFTFDSLEAKSALIKYISYGCN